MEADARGYGFYNVFSSVHEGQINISTTYPGVIRAFHRHKNQYDNWKVVAGTLEVCLYTGAYAGPHPDGRFYPYADARKLFYMNEYSSPLIIPPGIWHGFRVLGNENAKLLYHVTSKYDPVNPDEERAPWNAFYNWETVYK